MSRLTYSSNKRQPWTQIVKRPHRKSANPRISASDRSDYPYFQKTCSTKFNSYGFYVNGGMFLKCLTPLQVSLLSMKGCHSLPQRAIPLNCQISCNPLQKRTFFESTKILSFSTRIVCRGFYYNLILINNSRNSLWPLVPAIKFRLDMSISTPFHVQPTSLVTLLLYNQLE